MAKKHHSEDKNFDGLAPRFKRNIYDSEKGQLRLKVIARDFAEFVSGKNLRVLDVGGGQGHWAIEMARLGHSVLLSDISEEMLGLAQEHWQTTQQSEQLPGTVNFMHCSLQQLPEAVTEQFDIVVCHAVLEWLVEPTAGFEVLLSMLKPGGYLSLIVYNLNGLIMKNLLRTNYKKVLNKDYRGYRGSLTPLNPLSPDEVQQWLAKANLNLLCFSGIRTFHDYILDPEQRANKVEQMTELELELSRVEPFRSLGRYLHFLCQK